MELVTNFVRELYFINQTEKKNETEKWEKEKEFTKFQSKPPRRSADAPIYWNVSMLMTSITGQTTRVGSSATRSNNGSSQFSLHSQWLSKNVSTSAIAASAPRTRERTKPSRFSFRITRTLLIFANSKPSSAMNGHTAKVNKLKKRKMEKSRWDKDSQRTLFVGQIENGFSFRIWIVDDEQKHLNSNKVFINAPPTHSLSRHLFQLLTAD